MEAARVGTVKVTKSLAEQKAAAAEAAVKQGEASKKIGTAFLAIGAVAAVATALAIKEFADFDAKMSQVATLSHANAADMTLLTTAALRAGQKIGFTANEVADAEIEMVKAGISVKDILGGALPGALQLAAAGQIDVAQATEIATIAMTQFGLKGKDIPHVADLLAAGADKALGSVGDLGEALKSGGLVASQFGISLDDTIGTLSAFANAGLIGEVAGTDLRQMLLKLAKPSSEAAATMKSLGISVYDTNGHFVGMDGLAGQLQTKLSSLSEEQRNSTLATIFGSRAIAGANVLYKEGATGIDKWNKAVNAAGFAQQQATGKMDNLNGDLKKLQAAFQTDVIEGGSGANDTLREMTQLLTGLVSGVGDLPQPLLQAGLGIGAVVAVTSLLTGGVLKAIPALAAAKANLASVGISGRTAALGIGATAIAVTALVAILAAYAQANAEAAARTDELGQTLDAVTHQATAATAASISAGLALKSTFFGITAKYSAFDAAKALGYSLGDVTKAALGQAGALNKLQPILTAHVGVYDNVSEAAIKAGLSSDDYKAAVTAVQQGVGQWNSSLTNSVKISKQKAAADKEVADSTKAATTAGKLDQGMLQDVSAAAQDASNNISGLSDTLKNFGKTSLDARSAHRAFRAAIDDAQAALKTNGKTLDDSTVKGRANAAALDAIAAAANQAAGSQYALNGNSAQTAKLLDSGRSAFIRQAEAMGLSAKAANTLADAELATAGDFIGTVQIKGIDAAQNALNEFIRQNKNHQISILLRSQLTDLNGNQSGSGRGGTFANGGVRAYASGGVSSGIYPGGTPIYKFAEPETRWEAFISGKPSENAANRGYVLDAASRLGMLHRPPLAAAQSRQTVINNYSLTVPVAMSGHVIGNDLQAAKTLTDLVTKAVNAGVVSQGWNRQ
jgi:TP901 family phage tail tape measure protein